jgi:hypothetical protein
MLRAVSDGVGAVQAGVIEAPVEEEDGSAVAGAGVGSAPMLRRPMSLGAIVEPARPLGARCVDDHAHRPLQGLRQISASSFKVLRL